MSMFASTFRWLERKRYQYEVTFSLYMLTPTEKFIFNSIIFIIFSMVLIAACLYFPHHIEFLTDRAWFYYHGDDTKAAPSSSLMGGAEKTVAEVVVETVAAIVKESLGTGGQDARREL